MKKLLLIITIFICSINAKEYEMNLDLVGLFCGDIRAETNTGGWMKFDKEDKLFSLGTGDLIISTGFWYAPKDTNIIKIYLDGGNEYTGYYKMYDGFLEMVIYCKNHNDTHDYMYQKCEPKDLKKKV